MDLSRPRKPYGTGARDRLKPLHLGVEVEPYNVICGGCQARFLRGANTGWIDIDRCDSCAHMRNVRQLEARIKVEKNLTRRLVLRSQLLVLERA